MSKQEHRVNIENGKYTFVVPADDYRVSILRYGEPWHGPQGEASKALHAIMYELDAARVVVQAARAVKGGALPFAIIVALERHDSLTSDHEPPSAWCGDGDGAQAAPEKCPRCWFTPCRQMFQCAVNIADDGLDGEIQMMETEGNLGERWQRGLAWLRELRDRRAAECRGKESATEQSDSAANHSSGGKVKSDDGRCAPAGEPHRGGDDESSNADIKATLSAALAALGDVMLEMQRRKLLARPGVTAKTRELLSAKSLTDEQVGDLAARAFEAGAMALAKVRYPGATAFSCNLSEES